MSTAPEHDGGLVEALRDLVPHGQSSDVAGDPELHAVVRLAAAVSGAGRATINLLGPDTQHQLATMGFVGDDSPRSESMCAVTVRERVVVTLEDARSDARFAQNPWVDGRRSSVRFYAAAPLVTSDGLALGTICVFDDVPRPVPEGLRERLADLAAVTEALLQRRRQARQQTALAADARRASSELSHLHAELTERQEFTSTLLDTVPVGVVATDPDGRVVVFNGTSRAWHGLDADPAVDVSELPQAYDLFEADGVTPLAPERVPVLRALTEGEVSGAEIVIAPAGRARTTVVCHARAVCGAGGELRGAVVAMSDVTEQRHLEERLRRMALHDALTGLANRTLLMERIELALAVGVRSGLRTAVLYCDLDGFKAVNDGLGHASGDELLRRVAVRLEERTRPGDTVARLGGDEFVVVCPDVAGEDDALGVAERVLEHVGAPYVLDGHPARVGVSVGVALSRPGTTPAALLGAADAALYRAKQDGRGRVVVEP